MRPVHTGRFQFTVNGTMRQGVLYVSTARKAGESDDAMRVRAGRIASRRSGDAAPVLIRDNLTGEEF